MEWIAVTARIIRLPGSCCLMRQIDYQRQKWALVGMFVIMRQFTMRYGCAKFRMIIKMAMHMQMALTIMFIFMFMFMDMNTVAIHRPDQLRAKI
jgi:hypothetical protein